MAPNGSVVQYRLDGADRTTKTLTLGNIPAATWANATSLAASVVLEQVDVGYDPASNALLTTIRERFHDASTTATGLLGTPTSGINRLSQVSRSSRRDPPPPVTSTRLPRECESGLSDGSGDRACSTRRPRPTCSRGSTVGFR